jgi:Arc/MetJ family transcription regulator
MSRTYIELDDERVEFVMRRYGTSTKREAVGRALTEVVGRFERRDMLDMAGTGWDGDLVEVRRVRGGSRCSRRPTA